MFSSEQHGYSYDAAGDLTADALGNTYTYNVDGMLTASGGAQYVYAGLNQRIAKTGGSYPTETIYFLGQPIAFHNPSSGAYTDLIWAGGHEIATVPGTQTAQPTFRLLDHEGSLVMTTDASGNVTGTNVLSPYGETISSNTSDPYAYADLYQDTEYGGDAAWFRNYSTEQLRWTRPDSYNGSYDVTNPQSMNRYVYAMDNPLNNVDPTGLQDENGNDFPFDDPYMPADATWGTSYAVDNFQVSNSLANSFMSSGVVNSNNLLTMTVYSLGLPDPNNPWFLHTNIDTYQFDLGFQYTGWNTGSTISMIEGGGGGYIPAGATNKTTLTPQQRQQRKQDCHDGAIAVGTGLTALGGAAVITVAAWEDVVAVAGESLLEGGMTGLHLITGAVTVPATTVAVGFNLMMQNCGS
ncbi:MAG: RHS repeat-associated core domain-containing protein [Acidobacteriaceae bacterium]